MLRSPVKRALFCLSLLFCAEIQASSSDQSLGTWAILWLISLLSLMLLISPLVFRHRSSSGRAIELLWGGVPVLLLWFLLLPLVTDGLVDTTDTVSLLTRVLVR